MNYNKTIDDIVNVTGLKEPFIRKIIRNFDDILKPYIKRGDKNSLLFDGNAIAIFDKVKQLKEQNFTIETIKEEIEKSYEIKDSQTKILDSKTENNLDIHFLLNRLEEYHKEAINAKNELIKTQLNLSLELNEKEKVIFIQSEQLKLLTDGRTPEEVKKEHREKEEELFKLKQQVDELELMKIKEQKRQAILKELQSLEGKWFAHKKRQGLIAELQNL